MSTISPYEDFLYLLNNVLLGDEPSIEDFILLVGTLVAFIAFILWCCFPIQPKDGNNHRQFTCKALHKHQHQQQNANECSSASNDRNGGASGGTFSSVNYSGKYGVCATDIGYDNNAIASGCTNNGNCADNKNNHSRAEPAMSVHNDYIKNGHHCCS